MLAYLFDPGLRQAKLTEIDEPVAARGEVVLAVEACGLCRTDLHILDGDLRPSRSRIVLGHQVVGRVVEVGPEVDAGWLGRRCGVPWLAEPAALVAHAPSAARTCVSALASPGSIATVVWPNA